MSDSSDILAAIGRLHPLVLHFPVGLIGGVLALELWMLFRPAGELRPAIGILLALASVSAVVAAACGLVRAGSGAYDETLLFRHRFLGLGAAILAVLTTLLHRFWCRSERAGARRLYRLNLALCLIAITAAGYHGDVLTHGSRTPFSIVAGWLTRPSVDAGPESTIPVSATTEDQIFLDSIAPVLESHCWECHGVDKQEAGLRLDSRAAALAGGQSGKPAIIPGDAMGSRLVEAITLPSEDERAMPPGGKKRLEPVEMLALIHWINRGAYWSDSRLHAQAVPPPSETAVTALRKRGFRLRALSQGNPLLRVIAVPVAAQLSDLTPVAKQIAWLDLSGFELDHDEMNIFTDMPHLTRLELQHSNVTDDDLVHLAELPALRGLNLYATEIGDAGLEHLRDLRTLERIYLWRTEVTPAGVRRLQAALPNVHIDLGMDADAVTGDPREAGRARGDGDA